MDSNSMDDPNKLAWLRQQALDEMLATERQYVNDLITLQQVFMDKTKDILPAIYRRDIFHSFDAVLGVAKMFLQELETLPIHFAFLKVANFFKVYTAYCAGYNNSLIALTQSRKSCRDWDKFLKDTENTQQTNFLSLASFLIKPVQRICRYPLMLKEILKHTPPSHADLPLLSEALVLIEKITDHVNEGKRVAENMQRIVEIYNSFTDKEKPDICSPSRTLIREGDLMKISDGKLQNRHFFLFNDSVLYAKPTLLKKSEGLWVFCGQWALDRIQIVDLSSSSSPVSPSPFSLPSRASPTLFGNVSLRGSGGSEIIRSSGGTSVLGSGSSPSIITTSPKIIQDKSIDDTSSTYSSPSVSPASTPFSSPSLSSVSSPSPSPSIIEARRSSLVGNLSHKNPSHIPVIDLTPPSSPSLVHGRRHSNTETERRVDGGIRSVVMMNIKDQRNSQEMNPRAEIKRSLSEGGGDEFVPIQEDSGKSSSDTESKGNMGNSINLVRSQSIENQKLLASLPDNAQHCFIVYAPVMGKPKRYIICAPDLRTKMLWLNDLLVQWRKATLLSQSRAVRQVSQELGDRLDSLTASDDENSFQFSPNPNIHITTDMENQVKIAPKNTQSEVVKKEGNKIRSNEDKKPNIQMNNQEGASSQKTTRTKEERTQYPLNILGDKFDLTPEKLEQISSPNNKYGSERSERERSERERSERERGERERGERGERRERSERSERGERNERNERGERGERGERSDRVGRVERNDIIGTSGTSDRRVKDRDKGDKKVNGERYERKDLRESNELVERRDRGERKERREKDERGDRTDRSDRSDKSDKSDRSDRNGRVDKYDKSQRRLGKDSNSDWGYKSDISDKGYKSDVSGDSDREQRDRLERERRDRERTKARLLEKARQGINEKSTRDMEADRKYGRNKETRDKNEYNKEYDRRDRRDREPTREPTRRQARDKYEDRGRERDDRIVSPRGKEEQKIDLLRNLTCEEENEELWAHIAFLEVCKEKDEKNERRKKDREETLGMHSNSNNPEKGGRLQATARNTKGTSKTT